MSSGAATSRMGLVGTVRMLARCEIRRRWRSTVAITLLLGAVGAVVLATAAGARRSDTALERFNAFSRSSSFEISVGTPSAQQLLAFRRTPRRGRDLLDRGVRPRRQRQPGPGDRGAARLGNRTHPGPVPAHLGPPCLPDGAGRDHDRRGACRARASPHRESRHRLFHLAAADQDRFLGWQSRTTGRAARAVSSRRDRPAPTRPQRSRRVRRCRRPDAGVQREVQEPDRHLHRSVAGAHPQRRSRRAARARDGQQDLRPSADLRHRESRRRVGGRAPTRSTC